MRRKRLREWIFRHQIHFDHRPDAYMNGIYDAVEFAYDKWGRVSEITYDRVW